MQTDSWRDTERENTQEGFKRFNMWGSMLEEKMGERLSLLSSIIMILNQINSKINSPPTGKGYTPSFHTALWFSGAFCGLWMLLFPHRLSGFSLGPYLFIKFAVYLSCHLLAGPPPRVYPNCHVALLPWPGCKKGCGCCSWCPPTGSMTQQWQQLEMAPMLCLQLLCFSSAAKTENKIMRRMGTPREPESCGGIKREAGGNIDGDSEEIEEILEENWSVFLTTKLGDQQSYKLLTCTE